MTFNNNKGELQFPYEIEFVDAETNQKLLQHFTGEQYNRRSMIYTKYVTAFGCYLLDGLI